MLMVISNENIVRVYRIFLKITAIGMEEVKRDLSVPPTYLQSEMTLRVDHY
jgi:hypothetical protein